MPEKKSLVDQTHHRHYCDPLNIPDSFHGMGCNEIDWSKVIDILHMVPNNWCEIEGTVTFEDDWNKFFDDRFGPKIDNKEDGDADADK